jgi:hypothetical protein
LGINRIIALFLTLGIMAGAALYSAPATASGEERGLELLSRATKSYEAGSDAEAAALIESAFKAGLSGQLAARAILLRAQINERSGALAKALQDYSNAVWMGSLPEGEKQIAAQGKERMMVAMGLSAQPSAPAPTRRAEASAATVSAPAQPQAPSSGVLGFFSGMFGSSDKREASPAPQQADAAPAQAAPAPQKQPAKAPKTAETAPPKRAPKPAPVRVASAQPTLQPASASSVAASVDGYLIVFGAAGSEASGRASAQKIKAQLSDILVNRQLDVALSPGGGYQVQAGPYKTKSAAAALCSAMKQRGVSCQVAP